MRVLLLPLSYQLYDKCSAQEPVLSIALLPRQCRDMKLLPKFVNVHGSQIFELLESTSLDVLNRTWHLGEDGSLIPAPNPGSYTTSQGAFSSLFDDPSNTRKSG